MFDWLYNLFMQFVTFVLSFFGTSEKKVHFEEGVDTEAPQAQEQLLPQGEPHA